MKSFWGQAPRDLQQAVAKLAAIMHYESDRHWQTIKDPFGSIVSVRWPTEVPYTIHLEEQKEFSGADPL